MATSVLENPIDMKTLYVDDNSFTTFSHVIARTINAYEDSDPTKGVQDLTLGASSNVMIEAVESVSMYVKDSGDGIKLYTTTWDGTTRNDKQILGIDENAASNTTVITATANNALSLQPSDTYKTVTTGDMTLYTSNDAQHLSTTNWGAFVFDDSLRTDASFLAQQHLYANDFMGYSNTGLTGLNELSEAGFCFRMNDKLQIELIKYGKVNMQQGQQPKKVYKRVGIFGAVDITSNMDTDPQIGTYDPFTDLAVILTGPIAVMTPFETSLSALATTYSSDAIYTLLPFDLAATTGHMAAMTTWGPGTSSPPWGFTTPQLTYHKDGGPGNGSWVEFPNYSILYLPDANFSLAAAGGFSFVFAYKDIGWGWPVPNESYLSESYVLSATPIGFQNQFQVLSAPNPTHQIWVQDWRWGTTLSVTNTSWNYYAISLKKNQSDPKKSDVLMVVNGQTLYNQTGVTTWTDVWGTGGGIWDASGLMGISLNALLGAQGNGSLYIPAEPYEYSPTGAPAGFGGFGLFKRALTEAEAIALTSV